MNTKLSELKELVKSMAATIKQSRKELKTNQREGNSCWREQGLLFFTGRKYRWHHIAYSELRGRTRDEIEHPNADNPADESFISRIKEQYKDEPALYTNAA